MLLICMMSHMEDSFGNDLRSACIQLDRRLDFARTSLRSSWMQAQGGKSFLCTHARARVSDVASN